MRCIMAVFQFPSGEGFYSKLELPLLQRSMESDRDTSVRINMNEVLPIIRNSMDASLRNLIICVPRCNGKD